MIKWAAVVILVLGLGAAVLFVPERSLSGVAGARTERTDDTTRYRFAKIERGDMRSSVSATGTLAPVATVQVGSAVSGQIQKIYVDFNAQVRRGDPVAQIDSVLFEIAVEKAQAELAVARAAVETQKAVIARLIASLETVRHDVQAARANTEAGKTAAEAAGAEARRRQLLGQLGNAMEREKAEWAHQTALAQVRSLQAQEAARQSLVKSAEAELAAARSQLLNAEAIVRQREASVRHARIELERTVIRAPVDGIVVHRSVEAGQTVAASLQAPTLFLIAQDLRDMQVDASVDESEIGRITPGQPVEFMVDAHPGRRFSGSVVQIRKSPKTSQNVVTYTVVVKAPNPQLLLMPGMTATTRFITGETKDVLKVPLAALRFQPAGLSGAPRQDRVWVEDNGALQPVSVSVGASDGSHVAVTGEGLAEGVRVAVAAEGSKPQSSTAKRLIGVF